MLSLDLDGRVAPSELMPALRLAAGGLNASVVLRFTTAAIAHLAHSTPEAFRFTATDFNSYVTVSTADGAPRRENGWMRAATLPGLGIRPRSEVLGPRIVDIA